MNRRRYWNIVMLYSAVSALMVYSVLVSGCAMTPTQKKIGTAVLIIATTSVALSQQHSEQGRMKIPSPIDCTAPNNEPCR